MYSIKIIYVYYSALPHLSDVRLIAVINGVSRCSHMRSIEYWVEALKNQSCTMWGTRTTLTDFVVTYVFTYNGVFIVICRDVAKAFLL